MCLDSVTRTFPKNDNIRMGYKVFVRRYFEGKYIYNLYFDIDSSKEEGNMYSTPKERDGKYVQKAFYVYRPHVKGCQTKDWYEEGFHIHTTIMGAERFMHNSNGNVICEVIAWDIRALGTQTACRVLVAKNYRIMREVKPGDKSCV